MEIEDIIFSRQATVNVPDPYTLSLRILKECAGLGDIVEKKNTFETDGPVKSSEVEFDIVRRYDDYSQFRISVLLRGESNSRSVLEIFMSGSVRTKVEEEGHFTSVFAEYYLQSTYDRIMPAMKHDLSSARQNLEKIIRAQTSA